jgi:hypothetical protein
MSERKSWSPPAPEPQDESTSEPFLRRWSRLKADPAAREGERPTQPPAAAPPEDAAAPADPGDAPETAEEQLPPSDEDLPPLEALDEHSDYSGFMSSRVSATLRKQALRKLFRSQKFNYICELDDYIDDYTSFPPLGDMVTADMKHAAERLLKKQLEAEEADAAAAAAAAKDAEAASGATAAGGDTGTETDTDADTDTDTDTGAVAAAGTDETAPADDAPGESPDAATDPDEDKQRDA